MAFEFDQVRAKKREFITNSSSRSSGTKVQILSINQDKKENIDINIEAMDDLEEEYWHCQVCQDRFGTGQDLQDHLSKYHLKFNCGFCRETFKDKLGLEEHVQVEHDEKCQGIVNDSDSDGELQAAKPEQSLERSDESIGNCGK